MMSRCEHIQDVCYVVKPKKDDDKDILDFLSFYLEFFYQRPQFHPRNAMFVNTSTWDSDGKRVAYVAKINNQIVGTILLYPYEGTKTELLGRMVTVPTGYVSGLYIREDCRGRGLGTLLYHAILLDAIYAGYKKLLLHTHDFLPGGFPFWIKQGFMVDAKVDDAWGTLYMSLDL